MTEGLGGGGGLIGLSPQQLHSHQATYDATLVQSKGLKAYDKDNYRGIDMFPVITKIFEMILLKRLEDFARSKSYFSPLQFGSVGCLEASFVISESVNHKFERSNKVFSCFLDVKRPSIQYGLMGCFLLSLLTWAFVAKCG